MDGKVIEIEGNFSAGEFSSMASIFSSPTKVLWSMTLYCLRDKCEVFYCSYDGKKFLFAFRVVLFTFRGL